MKKVLLLVCAASVLMVTACKKEKDEPAVTPGGETPQPEVPSGDGVYRPAQKISTIVYGDERVPRTWMWEDGDLMSTNESDNCGGYQELASFSYDNHRLASMEAVVEGVPVEVGYVYNGKRLASVTASSDGTEVVDLTVTHNSSDKITRLSGNVDETLIGMLSQLMGEGMGNFFKKAPGAKLSLGDVDITADLQWQGDNVSQMVMQASVQGGITLGEVRQMVNLDSLLGSYSSLLALLNDTVEMPLSLVVTDTTYYTYDNNPNPFCGFLGEVNAAYLSACNVTETVSTASVSVTLTLQSMMGSLPIPFSYPIGSTTVSYTYTYDAAGFPLTVTDSEGVEITYTYLQ